MNRSIILFLLETATYRVTTVNISFATKKEVFINSVLHFSYDPQSILIVLSREMRMKLPQNTLSQLRDNSIPAKHYWFQSKRQVHKSSRQQSTCTSILKELFQLTQSTYLHFNKRYSQISFSLSSRFSEIFTYLKGKSLRRKSSDISHLILSS